MSGVDRRLFSLSVENRVSLKQPRRRRDETRRDHPSSKCWLSRALVSGDTRIGSLSSTVNVDPVIKISSSGKNQRSSSIRERARSPLTPLDCTAIDPAISRDDPPCIWNSRTRIKPQVPTRLHNLASYVRAAMVPAGEGGRRSRELPRGSIALPFANNSRREQERRSRGCLLMIRRGAGTGEPEIPRECQRQSKRSG